MLRHLEKNKVLTKLNHGFRSGYSCETQLLITINDLLKSYDKSKQIDMAILDISNAFDTTPQKLLHKLDQYGIRGPVHRWLTNFLTKRKMRVTLEGESSQQVTVDSGVPQGTVLGTILFLLCHINDLPDAVKSSVRAENWGMRFNATKCYIMSIKKKTHTFYQLGGHILEQVDSNPYLGLQISEDLKWSTHISNITKKANSTIGFLRRNLQHCPKECRKNAYISLVRSVLEYGVTIWDPYQKNDIEKLEKIERRGARFINKDYRSREEECIAKILKELKLTTLEERRKQQRLIFFYKVAARYQQCLPLTS
jgi:hypothetical protein